MNSVLELQLLDLEDVENDSFESWTGICTQKCEIVF